MLITKHTRNGTDVPHRWGWWHVACFNDAYTDEQTGDHPLLSSLTEYTYQREHTFTDPADGEVLVIQVGDTFSWWRDR